MPVPNTSAARTLGAGTFSPTYMISAFARIAESYSLARRIPTPSGQHSLNTFQVSSYQNWNVLVTAERKPVVRRAPLRLRSVDLQIFIDGFD